MGKVKCLICNEEFENCAKNNYVYCYVKRFSGINKIKEFGFNSVAVTQRI